MTEVPRMYAAELIRDQYWVLTSTELTDAVSEDMQEVAYGRMQRETRGPALDGFQSIAEMVATAYATNIGYDGLKSLASFLRDRYTVSKGTITESVALRLAYKAIRQLQANDLTSSEGDLLDSLSLQAQALDRAWRVRVMGPYDKLIYIIYISLNGELIDVLSGEMCD